MSDSSRIDNKAAIIGERPKNTLLHTVKMVFCSILLIFWCVLMLSVHLFWKVLRIPNIQKCYFIFHSGCCRLFNLHCTVRGELSAALPTLFLSNHVSYLDVFVLGKYVPAFFIAKSEVANWPILGWLAKVQNTLFFERNSKKVRHQMKVMSDHFDQSGNLILFPEGTSTEGEHVQPFKSSLLQSAESSIKEVFIQPVTIVYKSYRGAMMSRDVRDQYAWYATMPFASHFFNVLGMGKAEVELIFHKPVTLNAFSSRKECAQYCFEQVSSGLSESLQSNG
jgi:1-acyl-sn-glycerol-3-phosphate acyltransferase